MKDSIEGSAEGTKMLRYLSKFVVVVAVGSANITPSWELWAAMILMEWSKKPFRKASGGTSVTKCPSTVGTLILLAFVCISSFLAG